MPRAYSGDLRRRVVAAVLKNGQSREAVARRFAVGRSTVYRWVAVAQSEGRLEAQPMRGGPKPTIRDEGEAALRRLVAEGNHLNLTEYRDRLAAQAGVRAHPRTLGRALRRLGLTRKKAKPARRRAGPSRGRRGAAGMAPRSGAIPAERLVFLDESGALTNLARLHGWSPRGKRALGVVPCGAWERVTVLGALGLEGIVGAMSIAAATDRAVFLAYLEQVLLPALRRVKPDAVLVMGNLGAHKTPALRALLDGAGFRYHYLPPYSPDLNPIELAWAKVKAALRKAAARTVDGLHTALGPALAAIAAEDAQGFFRHAGYAYPN